MSSHLCAPLCHGAIMSHLSCATLRASDWSRVPIKGFLLAVDLTIAVPLSIPCLNIHIPAIIGFNLLAWSILSHHHDVMTRQNFLAT